MAKKEAKTDRWVRKLLEEAKIDDKVEEQGSEILEINTAFKTASKSGTGKVGFPDFCGVVKDFLIVIEDKDNLVQHIKRTENDLIDQEVKSVKDYAVNGAYFYGMHLIENTSYKKVIAIGVSGNEHRHRISPIFIDERKDYIELPEIETFINFSENNINEYYVKEILKEKTNVEKETSEIIKDAAELHEDLRNYGSIQDKDKPLIVSGILLALQEIEHKNFSIDKLAGGKVKTDGEKICEAIKSNLDRANVTPETKKDKLLNQFSVIKDTTKINEENPSLEEVESNGNKLAKTPLKHYTEFLYNRIFHSFRYNSSAEDYLGRFYAEFMSYSGGDGQTLGIILTPRHITELFCKLIDIKSDDKVLDPCCGTGGFLIAAMHHMLRQTDDETEQNSIKQDQLFGIEDQSYMFTIATTNMILRGDGKSNLQNLDFLKQNPSKLQLKGCTVGLMNPPYSQGSKSNSNLYEINFTEKLLDSITKGGRVAVIVPQSAVTGKTTEEKAIKANILKYHTLEGVITLNKNTFYRVGTNPCIAIFTAGIPHRPSKKVKFINFEDDGYIVSKHVGLEETVSAKDKKQHLLDVWFNRMEFESRFCVETTIELDDEWLHSFYYFNDEIPTDADFEKVMADYLSFECSMILKGKEDLFDYSKQKINDLSEHTELKEQEPLKKLKSYIATTVSPISDRTWKEFTIEDIFTVKPGKRLETRNKLPGKRPFIGATDNGNGVTGFVDNENSSKDSNVLGVNYNGAPGIAFYHPYEGIFTDDVKRLHLKNYNDNKFILLFFVTIFAQQRIKYSYGYKFNERRMLRQKLMLPTTDNGEPDYLYMEQYSKNIMTKKYKQYLDFIDTKIEYI